MKFFFAVIFCLFVLPAHASVCSGTPTTFVNGTVANADQVNCTIVPHAATNVALKAMVPSYAGQTVIRDGFTLANDGGAMTYSYSLTNCTLNTGAGDNGSQVAPGGFGGCWNWMPPASGVSPMVFGPVGNGIADDTSAIQVALNAATNTVKLLFDSTHLYLFTSPLTSSGKIDIEGTLPGGNDGIAQAQLCTAGLTTVSNVDGLVLTGEQAVVHNLCMQMAVAGSSASAGTAIQLGAPSGPGYFQAHDDISGNTIFRPYYGLEFGGAGGLVRESQAIDNIIRSPGAIALTVGRGTTGGKTVGIRLVNNRIGCDSWDVTAIGFAFFDGAVKYDGTTVGPAVCGINTEVVPGASQNVNGEFTGVLGDSAGASGGVTNPKELYIEPQAASGTVNWLAFHDAWVGALVANANAANDKNVYIGNANSGNCTNITFNGLTAHSGAASGHTQTTMIDIEGCTNIAIVGSIIDAWRGTATNGILLNNANATGPKFVTITGNRFGNVASGVMTNAISLATQAGTALDYVVISGNEMGNTSFITNPIVTDLGGASAMDRNWTIDANEGVDDACPTVASATTVVIPGAASCIHLSGNTTVATIYPAWKGRKVTMITDSGLSFNTGGTGPGICGANITIPAAGAAYLQFNAPQDCWMHQ